MDVCCAEPPNTNKSRDKTELSVTVRDWRLCFPLKISSLTFSSHLFMLVFLFVFLFFLPEPCPVDDNALMDNNLIILQRSLKTKLEGVLVHA